MCKPRDNPKELSRIMQREDDDDRGTGAIVLSTPIVEGGSPSRNSSVDVSSPRTPSFGTSSSAAAEQSTPQSIFHQQRRSAMTAATMTFTATLLVRKSDKSVLYAEAGKDLVDTLLGFLALPIGSALRLLRDARSLPKGGISSMYTSIQELDESFLYSDKDSVLDPRPTIRASDLMLGAAASSGAAAAAAALAAGESSTKQRIYYKCSNHGCLRFVIDLPGQICPVCKFAMSHKLELIVPGVSYPPPSPNPRGSGSFSGFSLSTPKQRPGFVRKNRNFIITDSLEVLPLSTITSVMLLAKLNLENLQDLESVQVNVGTTEVLQLLKASMSSTTALTDVFKPRIIAASG